MAALTMIKPHMEVLGSDGAHVGTVDRVVGSDEVELAKDDSDAGGEAHVIPLNWIVHVEMKVHLRQPGAEVMARWRKH